MNVGDILSFFANRYPDKPAVYYHDKIITYGELNIRANKLGNKLLSLGFQVDDKIAILMRNCSEYVEIVFGMAKIGAIPVCVNFRLVGEEIKYIVNDSEALFTPCCYQLTDVETVHGSKVEPIKEIVSFRGRFCEQAKSGESVIAEGKLERVQQKGKDDHFRLLLGSKPSDHMVLI